MFFVVANSMYPSSPGTKPPTPLVPPQGITPALTILKEGLIGGSPDEKEEAARVLVEVIRLASSKTLSTGKVRKFMVSPFPDI